MTVDFMRLVDKWIGIPACLFFSGFHKLMKRFGTEKNNQDIKKILFLQISEMGSAISGYSAIKKAKELYPKAEIYYFIFSEMQDSVHLLDIIPKENVFTVTSKSLIGFVFGLLKMIWKMRREKFDAVLDLELFSRLSSLLSYLFNIPIRVAFHPFHMEGLYRGNYQTHKVLYNHMKHISHNFLSLVYALKENRIDLPHSKILIPESDIMVPKIISTEENKKTIMEKLQAINPEINNSKKIILLNPNASELLPLRRWPMEHYINLTKRLLEHNNTFIVITGVESEMKDAEAIVSAVKNSNCINFAGQTSLKELIDLYNISDILLSNDSGPPNFASLTDIQGLVFFGPETPICYKPLGENIEALYSGLQCSPCVSAYNHRKSACQDNKCLQAITVDEVYAKIMKAIFSS